MRLFRPSLLGVRLFREALFREKTTEKVLYLTFDDGPDIGSTLQLLNILAIHRIKALFFCSGRKASDHPGLINKIKSDGHLIGNHGYNHLNGLLTAKQKYLSDIKLAEEFTSGTLFRPPYGRLRVSQYNALIKTYRIIMWDIMPYDFDRRFGSEKSLAVLKKMIRPGSVIVLHDKPESNVQEFLDAFILFAIGKGYRFDIPGTRI
jgi:peptidoglycan/xylan/chitin deacetylase (PgdA/CDA1 family)